MKVAERPARRYEAVIGLEVHLQVLTVSKLFCGCSAAFGQEANSQVCPVCLGLPGALPVLNRAVVEQGIRMALATHCQIAPFARFARKNYFYPDLPKGYQISMYELPLARNGSIAIAGNGIVKQIGLTRIQIEEDAGKSLHDRVPGKSHIDLNRSGVPLLEIVSAPDIQSPEEAVAYLKKLREIARYVGVSDADMEKGNFRCDANVSLRYPEAPLGVRTEIKNLNSFRFIHKAIQYEIERQAAILDRGEKTLLETRLWDAKAGATASMRSKEEAHDYRYFPEPDLVPLQIDSEWVAQIKASLPELADAKRERLVKQYEISPEDAAVLTSSSSLADFFEKTVAAYGPGIERARAVSHFLTDNLLRVLKEDEKDVDEVTLRPEDLAALFQKIDEGVMSWKMAKAAFEEIYFFGKPLETIITERGWVQMSDEAVLTGAIEEVLAAYPGEVEKFRSGKTKLFSFFVGEVMKKTGGKANPVKLNHLLKAVLEEGPVGEGPVL